MEEFESGVGSTRLHAMLHIVVENQIALGDDTPVAATLERLVGEGLDRHDAIHAIGGILTQQMYGALKEKTPVNDEKYFTDLAELNAAQWLSENPAAETSTFPPENSGWAKPAEPFHRESPKIGRNDPCPCGSGKKFKKCCINFAN